MPYRLQWTLRKGRCEDYTTSWKLIRYGSGYFPAYSVEAIKTVEILFSPMSLSGKFQKFCIKENLKKGTKVG